MFDVIWFLSPMFWSLTTYVLAQVMMMEVWCLINMKETGDLQLVRCNQQYLENCSIELCSRGKLRAFEYCRKWFLNFPVSCVLEAGFLNIAENGF
jgi:hypothetical protein